MNPVRVALAACFVPGAGHLWAGQRVKGLVFMLTLPLMFAIGLALEGRLFPFEPGQPLVALAAIADVGIGLPYIIGSRRLLGRQASPHLVPVDQRKSAECPVAS